MIKKILGALSNALILVSIFTPFINYESASTSLWDVYKLMNNEYIIYIIIVCCILSVLLFAIGKYTEVSFFTAGMVMFFILREIIDIVKDNSFSILGIGFYLLIIGELLLLIMTFINREREVF